MGSVYKGYGEFRSVRNTLVALRPELLDERE